VYQYSDIRTVHLEVTQRCQAACPMCDRNMNGGADNPHMTNAELSLEDCEKIFSIPFIQQLNTMYMCGNLGDPIVAKDTLEIFKYFRKHNPKMWLSMNTNAGARDSEWWEELASIYGRMGAVIFSVDGLRDTNHLYRQNVNWDIVERSMRAFRDADGIARWDYIIFEHNKHQIEEKEWNSIESILGILKQFIDQGKIRYIGLSNESAWGLSKFLELSKLYDLPRVMSVQNPYNLLNRTYEVGLAEISVREQSGLLAYSPLASGVLSGKYRNNQKPEGSRLQLFGDYFPRYAGKSSNLAVEEYFKVAKKYKISLTQLSLAFVNQQPFVTSNIIGATTTKQLKEDIESINIKLSSEIIEEINLVHKKNPNPAP